MVITSDPAQARHLEESLLAAVDRHGYSKSAMFAIKLAFEEAITNALKHGNRRDPRKTVQVRYDISADKAIIVIADQGPGFDMQAVPNPIADENLEKPSGRGLMLMRAYMDEVRYNDKGNEVYMVKLNR
jgi:serine/threonine-protein kinase RsbW